MKYLLLFIVLAIMFFLFSLTPKQKCEMHGRKWNFNFDQDNPGWVCDSQGTIRFGRTTDGYVGSDGKAYPTPSPSALHVEASGGGGGGIYPL